MLDHRLHSPTDRITALVNRMLTERSLRFPAFPDDDLRSAGLSSLDMVNLVLAVESEFDVSIPDADITPARFRSITTIAALVTALLSATNSPEAIALDLPSPACARWAEA
jgi:acyl carrier protein